MAKTVKKAGKYLAQLTLDHSTMSEMHMHFWRNCLVNVQHRTWYELWWLSGG